MNRVMGHRSRSSRSVYRQLGCAPHVARDLHRQSQMAHFRVSSDPGKSPLDCTIRQATRARRKGRHRKAMLLLRKAAFEASERPGLWTRYALCCMREGRNEDGNKAFAHAIWLCRKAGIPKRTDILIELQKNALTGDLPRVYRPARARAAS